MSLSKVQKQIHNLDPKLREVPLLRKIPVVLSDSTDKYLEKVVLINVYCCKQFHSETFCIYWIVRRLWNSFHGVVKTAGMRNIKYKLRFVTFHK